MDNSLHPAGHSDALPDIRQVPVLQPLAWLGRGWDDLLRNPSASLAYGALFAVAGYLILSYAADKPYLFTAAVSGFVLLAPMLATGIYELSRRHGLGEPARFSDSLLAWRRNGASIAYFGLFLVLVALAWERLSAILFAFFYAGDLPTLQDFYRTVFLSGDYLHFVVAYFVVGGALAALVFGLSAVSVPMMLDRETDIATAMMSSLRAVALNVGAMLLWAVLIVALVAVGFLTWLVGMVVIMPLLGHASWHAYRDIAG